MQHGDRPSQRDGLFFELRKAISVSIGGYLNSEIPSLKLMETYLYSSTSFSRCS